MSIQLGGTIKLGTSSGTAVDYSSYISQLTINFTREMIDVPATFGQPIKSQSAGSEQNTLTIEFFSPTTAASVWHELYNAFKTSSSQLYFEALYNAAAAGADNERWSGLCIVSTLDTVPTVGSLRQQSQTFPITSAGVTRATV
jgi:hypothetical protein